MSTAPLEYSRAYQNKRNAERRSWAIKTLGGKCVVCGSRDRLEIDHIDPSTKSFTISGASSASNERFEREVRKCQLLCRRHHHEKTVRERGFKMAAGTHGTLSAYRYCKCDLCRAAKSLHSRLAREKRADMDRSKSVLT